MAAIQKRRIYQITDKPMDYLRERVLKILLHEINHIYTEAIANSVDWKDMDDKDKNLECMSMNTFLNLHMKIILFRKNTDRVIMIMSQKFLHVPIRKNGKKNIFNILMSFSYR